MFIRTRLENLKRDLESRIGDRRAAEALSGWERIGDGTPPEETGEWFAGFVRRLDALGESEAVRASLQYGSCAFSGETVEKIKRIHSYCRSVKEFADEISRQNVFGKALAVKGSVLYITKRPICESGYSNRFMGKYTDLCHCPLACTAKEPVPKTFCHCGGGYYKKLFDELWQADVKVEPVSAYIAGSQACVFAVHIPGHIPAGGDA
jgi:hypothetical protein